MEVVGWWVVNVVDGVVVVVVVTVELIKGVGRYACP